MDFTADSEAKILQKILPKCVDLLHVNDIKDYLFSSEAITLDEYEKLCLDDTQRNHARNIMLILMRKGPDCATQLLQALEKSVSSQSPQSSHYELIRELKKELGLLEDSMNGHQHQVVNGTHGKLALYVFVVHT